MRPVEHALLPDEEESGENQHDEHQHFEKRKHLELLEDHGPRVQEDGFNIEEDEQHRDQIKLD